VPPSSSCSELSSGNVSHGARVEASADEVQLHSRKMKSTPGDNRRRNRSQCLIVPHQRDTTTIFRLLHNNIIIAVRPRTGYFQTRILSTTMCMVTMISPHSRRTSYQLPTRPTGQPNLCKRECQLPCLELEKHQEKRGLSLGYLPEVLTGALYHFRHLRTSSTSDLKNVSKDNKDLSNGLAIDTRRPQQR